MNLSHHRQPTESQPIDICRVLQSSCQNAFRPVSVVWFGLLLTVSIGCSNGPKRVHPPNIDAEDAGTQAIQMFDKDNDGMLGEGELSNCPALSLNRLDKDGNAMVSSDEIKSRIRAWQDSRVGMMAYQISITLKGQPLSDATVSLEPLEFLADDVFAAEGISDADGQVVLSVEPSKRPTPTVLAVHCGFYRMRVSKKVDGVESIPAKYNSETILGIEIAPDVRSGSQTIELD